MKYYDPEAQNIPDCEDIDVYSHLRNQSVQWWDRTAINYFGKKYTFESLFRNIDEIANAFLRLGVKEKDIVILSLPNIPENIFCFYALNKIGAIADFIDLRSKGQKLIDAINATGSQVIVATDLFSAELDTVIKSTSLKTVIIASPKNSMPPVLKRLYSVKNKKIQMSNIDWTLWENFQKSGRLFSGDYAHNVSKNNPACILHTSGTTGVAKGVVLSNEAFLEMFAQIKNCGLQYEKGDTFLNQVPPFLAYNIVSATNNPLSLGLEVIMLPDYQPEKFADNLYKYKPNHVIAGPADWTNFLDNKKVSSRNYSFLKSMISGSDKINTEQKECINRILSACGCDHMILEGYGMTEISAAAVMNLPQHNVKDSVGIPLPKVNLCIFDNSSNKELGYGQTGEICMSSPTVMAGYYNLPEETNAVLKRHEDGAMWLHSGDLGYISEDGNLYLQGRLKRLIVRHDGIKISPFVLENTIAKHPKVSACCVVGRFDEEHHMGQVPVAYIVLSDSEETMIDNIQGLCEQELSADYLPHDYVILDSLPLTPNGKVDYRALEKMAGKENEY